MPSTVIVKDRDRDRDRDRDWDRDWDTESMRSSRRGVVRTVRRYKVPDDNYAGEETRISIRERERVEPRSPDRVSYRVIERERSAEPPRGRTEHEDLRIIERRRSISSSSSSSASVHEREIRIHRDREVDNRSHHHLESPYSLEKYSKSTEYFSRPEPQPYPQPIVIRNDTQPMPIPQPIIIRDQAPQPQQIIIEREKPTYDIVERTEVVEKPPERAMVRRERVDEDDYYYERRVREVERPRSDYWHRDRDHWSDDDVEYRRRVYYESDSDSDAHKRHLAEGALGGVALAEVMRHRRRRTGEEPGNHAAQVVGYGAMGALGMEAYERYRNRSHSRSRSRHRHRHHKHHRRHRSRSMSDKQKLAGAALLTGAAALAYAAGRRGSNNTTIIETPRRSRSRRRRGDVDLVEEEEIVRSRSSSRHMDPKHRNSRTAQAGALGAAAAAIAQRIRSRSRSRKGKKSRSRSHVRQAVPVVAAGLGTAAAAGLYEKQKARKEARSRSRSRSLSRSRSRSRSVPPASGGLRHSTSDTALVEYGNDPILTTRRHGRSRSRSASRSTSRGRLFRGRRRGSSSRSSSPDLRKRSRSRNRGLAQAALAAGVAGVAAHEATKRRERKRAEREDLERRHHEDSSVATFDTDQAQAPYFPMSNEFPPPPAGYVGSNPYGTNMPQVDNHAAPMETPPAAYNPADFGTMRGPTLPEEAAAGAPRDYSPGYAQYQDEQRAADAAAREREHARRADGPENVSGRYDTSFDRDGINPYKPQHRSASASPPPGHLNHHVENDDAGGKTVTFAPNPEEIDPSEVDVTASEMAAQEDGGEHDHHRRHGRGHDARRSRRHGDRRSSSSEGQRRRDGRDKHVEDHNDSDDSGETIELPPRFDSAGRLRTRTDGNGSDGDGDALDRMIKEVFEGRGGLGRAFQSVVGDLMRAGGGGGRGSGRRRSR